MIGAGGVPSGIDVHLVARPEQDCTEVYVVKRGPNGERWALVAGSEDSSPASGWHPVAAGADAHIFDRITGAPGVDLFLLTQVLAAARAIIAADAL